MGTHTAIAIGLILYVVLTTVVSFFMMSRVRKPSDYLVAGRGLPNWVLTGTIVGTCIGTRVIVGGSGAGSSTWLGRLRLSNRIGPRHFDHGIVRCAEMRHYKFMTLSEEVACYYEGNRVVSEFSNISCFCRNCAG